MACAETNGLARRRLFRVTDYDLAATLNSGQAFRWWPVDGAWEGVVHGRWVRLRQLSEGIRAEVAEGTADWRWLERYLGVEDDLAAILSTFPADVPLRRAVAACRGLRLLRQEPWECLASFVLSSTKQIVQIRQMVELLSRRYGTPVAVPETHAPAFAFPPAARLAACTEEELRECRMGFRARYLRAVAGRVADGSPSLDSLACRSLAEARAALMEFPGVGRKIADCVLLFACGHPRAFPIDVWVLRALRGLYFEDRQVAVRQLHAFAEAHFGSYAGYAQQYLFHHLRQQAGRVGRSALVPNGPPLQRSLAS